MAVCVCLWILLLCWARVATGEDVHTISDEATLRQYLCPGNRTLPPNTKLVLSEPELIISNISESDTLCLIENTTNLTIAPSQNIFNRGYLYVKVYCFSRFLENQIGFGFFNVTNLTMSSVVFIGCGATVTPEAVKFVNESHQYLYYDNLLPVALFFNHCFDLKIYNVSFGFAYHQGVHIWYRLGIGINLCGNSEIINLLPESSSEYPLQRLVLYFTDSKFTSEWPELKCNLTVISNAISSCGTEFSPNVGSRLLIDNIISDFTLFLTQSFVVNVSLDIGPYNVLMALDITVCRNSMDVVIGFIDSAVNSHVALQGHGIPYDTCLKQRNDTPSSMRPIELVVMYYETKKFSYGTATSLLIKDTSFVSLYGRYQGNQAAVLQIMKLTGKLSHEVVLENVSWCYNDLTSTNWFSTLVADSTRDSFQGELNLKLNNIFMYNNVIQGKKRRKRSNCLVCFSFVNVTMTGTNYFANNSGGSVIGVEGSNLTVSGDLTIKDGYAYKGGAINLDSTSTLYLKEPLVARFYNNFADYGNAIFAPIRAHGGTISVIQIWPTEEYSLDNVTDLSVQLHFNQNGDASFYAPHFSFFGNQTSPNFDFESYSWDFNISQYAYTTLIDAILHMDMVDKFISLSNGLCVELQPGQGWECDYIDNIVHKIFNEPQGQQTTNHYMHSTEVYPGQVILSVFYVKNQVFDIGYFEELDESMYMSNYMYWNATTDGSDFSIFYHYQYSFNDDTGYYVVMLTDIDIQLLSLPIIQFYRLKCPLGFCLINGSCICDPILHNRGYNCYDNNTITTPSGYWTDIIQTEFRFAKICPPNFCKDWVTFLPTDYDQNLTKACVGNRKGILCGECQDGLSVVFGFDACSSDCTDVYLLTFPVYALAGLLLVLVLFVLRLTVATGTINGVIFYANILGLVMDKLTAMENIHTHYEMFLRVFISFLNLDLGFPLCLYKGMTTVGKVGLQFVFPVYLWSIVIALILLARVSTRVANLISKSSVQVLATLFYLSFSKLLRTAIVIFSPSTIHVIEGCGNYTSRLVWYFDGHDYGHSTHAVLLTLAVIFTLLFLLPYALLVTFSSFLVRFRVVNRFKPFIDAYGGPFKDKWRFWFGLRLWITILLFGLDGALEGRDAEIMFTAHNIIFMLFILLQAFVRPFKNSLVGLLDISFMANYWLLVASLFWAFNDIFPVMYYFLTSAAVLTIVSILIFNCLYLKYQDSLGKLINVRAGYQAIVNESDSDNELFRAAENRAHYSNTY